MGTTGRVHAIWWDVWWGDYLPYGNPELQEVKWCNNLWSIGWIQQRKWFFDAYSSCVYLSGKVAGRRKDDGCRRDIYDSCRVCAYACACSKQDGVWNLLFLCSIMYGSKWFYIRLVTGWCRCGIFLLWSNREMQSRVTAFQPYSKFADITEAAEEWD